MNIITLKVLLAALVLSPFPALGGKFSEGQRRAPRFRLAEAQHQKTVEQVFREAGAAWPPQLLFRGFKQEGVFETWAAPATGRRWVLVSSLPVCAASGALGPKRRSGDFQVPEGFYTLNRFNPWSRFHLSLGLDYPNAVDRAHRVRPHALGGDIFIHGGCVTIGCIPLEDGPMEYVYLAAVAARDGGQRHIPVHLMPCRFGSPSCESTLLPLMLAEPTQASRWAELRAGHAAFEATRRPPQIRALSTGHYRIQAR